MPADVVKTRLQAQRSAVAEGTGGVVPYRSSVDCLLRIVKEEGALALWKGVTPALGRVGAMFGFSLATYDTAKEFWENRLGSGSTPAHVLSSMTSGFVAAVVACPFDVRAERKRERERTRKVEIARELGTNWRRPATGPSPLLSSPLLSSPLLSSPLLSSPLLAPPHARGIGREDEDATRFGRWRQRPPRRLKRDAERWFCSWILQRFLADIFEAWAVAVGRCFLFAWRGGGREGGREGGGEGGREGEGREVSSHTTQRSPIFQFAPRRLIFFNTLEVLTLAMNGKGFAR